MVKACIFDHDGVIVDSEPFHRAAWHKAITEFGIKPSDEEMNHIKGKTRKLIIKDFFGDIDEVKAKEIGARKDEIFYGLLENKLKLIDGFAQALEHFKKKGIKLAVATSALRHRLNFTFSLFDIEKYFDVVMTAESVINGKPDPEIYLSTAKELLVDPKECIVFEDSFAGVEAARAAGMKVVLVETSHKLNEFADGSVNRSIVNFEDIDQKLFGLL